MIRDTSIQYELACKLKENRFINYDNDNLISNKQIDRVNEYLDDILIDAFFSLNSFEPIIIPTSVLSRRQTENGYVKCEEDFSLNLSNRYDRYTFIEAFSQLCLTAGAFYSEAPLSKDEKQFITALGSNVKLYCAYGRSFLINTGVPYNPYVEPFKESFKAIDFGSSKAVELYCFRDFVISSSSCDVNMYYYEHIDYYYSKIRNNKIFGNYTWQDILSIYSILVEKLHLEEDSISALIALYIPKKTDIEHQILAKFHFFEMNYADFFDPHFYIKENDLFLRFVNAEKSRAFLFKALPKENFISVQFFDREIIEDVDFYNTLVLPYHYNSLNK